MKCEYVTWDSALIAQLLQATILQTYSKRRRGWSSAQQSEFLAALDAGFPIGLFTVARLNKGWILLDGNQRMHALLSRKDNKICQIPVAILTESHHNTLVQLETYAERR